MTAIPIWGKKARFPKNTTVGGAECNNNTLYCDSHGEQALTECYAF